MIPGAWQRVISASTTKKLVQVLFLQMQEKGRASICLLRCLQRPSTLSSTAEPKAEQLFSINSSTLNIASMTLP